MNPDGSEIRNVTNHKDVAWTYYSTPGKLLFVSDRGACRRCYFLYESNTDGTGVRTVTNLQLEDSWSDAAPGRYDIMVMNYKTKEVKKLTGASEFKCHQAPVFVQIAVKSP